MSVFSRIFGNKANDDKSIQILEPSAFKKAINKDKVQLIDVRTEKEFKEGAIPHAVNLDFFQGSKFLAGIGKLDKNKPVYLYCRSGNRSQKAAGILRREGFSEIYDLKGGYLKY